MPVNTTVCILLSTYNGEKYLEEQLQSIFSQTYWSYCTLFVRDDGSKDGTLAILKKYEAEGKLILSEGENIGFVKSFFWLIKNAPDCDYYSFADQDDVWKRDKIEHGVKILEANKCNLSLLYFSDYAIIDGQGKSVNKHYISQQIKPSFFNAMTLNQASGFTMLFNRILRDSLITIVPEKGQYHDYWVYLYANAFGKVLYDSFICAEYRRHSNNESETSIRGFALFNNRVKRFFINNSGNSFAGTLAPFRKYFYERLSVQNKKILDLFCSSLSLKSSISKTFFPARYRNKLFEDIAIRILFLLRRM